MYPQAKQKQGKLSNGKNASGEGHHYRHHNTRPPDQITPAHHRSLLSDTPDPPQPSTQSAPPSPWTLDRLSAYLLPG